MPQIIGTMIEVRELRHEDGLEWQTFRLRANERGYLEAKFARMRVWLVYDHEPRQEWRLISQDAVQITYVLSNAPETIDLKTMVWRKTHRYFIERSNENAKDEFGDDFGILVCRKNASRLATAL